jgi:type II secretory pathway component PulF
MPTYQYRVKAGPTEDLDGEIVADSRTAAIARLQAQGYSPVWVRAMAPGRPGLRVLRRSITSRDVNVFTRQLASLLRGGVPILRALQTILDQTESARLRGVVEKVLAAVRDGQMLSQALAQHPRVFPELYVNMVRAGESGGILDDILLRLAEARERDDELRSKVRAAAAYPVLVLLVGAVSLFVVVTFFLPRIVHLFDGLEGTLPLPTRIVLAISAVFSRWWPWLLAGAALVGGACRWVLATERGRTAIDRFLLDLPLVGRFLRDADLVRFARTLAQLVVVGISIDRAIALSAHVLGNRLLRQAILDVGRNTVLKGAALAAGLRRHAQIPAFVTNMVAVGEESGRLEEALDEIGAFYQRELDRDLRLMTTLLEPALILMVGAIMGFIIFAMLLPVFELGQSLG